MRVFLILLIRYFSFVTNITHFGFIFNYYNKLYLPNKLKDVVVKMDGQVKIVQLEIKILIILIVNYNVLMEVNVLITSAFANHNSLALFVKNILFIILKTILN